jgi:hypothetical protein
MSDLTCLASRGHDPTERQQFGFWAINKPWLLFQDDPRQKFWSFLTSSSSPWDIKTRRCFRPSVTKPSPKLRKIHHHVQEHYSPTKIRWHISYGRPNLPTMCDVMLRRCSLTIMCTFSAVYWASCGVTTATIVSRTLSMSDSPTALKTSFLQRHCHRTPFSAFHAFTIQSSRILKQNLKGCCSVRSAVRMSRSTP